MEQRNTEALFKHLDLPAYGTCGYAKFCSRARETSMAGRRFEKRNVLRGGNLCRAGLSMRIPTGRPTTYGLPVSRQEALS